LFNVPFCVLSQEEINELLVAKAIVSGCHVMTGAAILFNSIGELIPCNHLADFPMSDWKNVKTSFDNRTFKEFWESGTITSVRKAASVYRSEHCMNCVFWGKCLGGCPLFWTAYNPQQYIKGFKTSYKEMKE